MAANSEVNEVKGQDTEPHLGHEIERLDDLLKQYLGFLDEYETARQELSRQFSAGFFNLAQANRSADPGRRYGQDYYDERMQASRRVSVITSRTGDVRVGITSATRVAAPTEQNEKEGSNETASDTLRWFGILVPPALRSAKSDFTIAIEGPIPRILNVTKQMHQLEHEISRLRKSIKKRSPASGVVEDPKH